LKETARWDYIVKHASQNDIAVIIDQAMSDIEADNPGALSKNLFSTLGADKNRIKSLIDSVNQINEKRFHEEDLIGRVYEYFLQIYAASGTKEDGEFYTPACIVKLIAEMIEPFEDIVYDPCCGSGGMFVQSMNSTFTDDQHKDTKVDYIMANPPFNLKPWRTKEIENDYRWSGYCGSLVAPRESNANYAWIFSTRAKSLPILWTICAIKLWIYSMI